MRFVLLGLLISGLSACANLTPPASVQQLKANSSYWVSYDSSRRGAWIATSATGSIKSCAEPAPDVALSFNTGIKGSLEIGGAKAAGIDASAAAVAAALAGRDNVVLLAREALFRICEQVAMGNLDKSQIKPLFQDVFEQTKQIAIAQSQTEEEKTKQIQLLQAK